MKKIIGLVLFLIVTAGAAAYAQDESTDMDRSTDTSTMEGAAGADKGTSMGGAQSEPAMEYSYDQRNQFIKTMKVKYEGLQKRINVLDENSKKSPANVNAALNPKVSELRAMSEDSKKKIEAAKNTNRESWTTTKSGIIDSLNSLEKSVMDAEKMVK